MPHDIVNGHIGHNHTHGEIGIRASHFTEGGYCTLFREGARLKGRGGTDDLIANACKLIYEDEFGHMLAGIVGLDQAPLSDDDFQLMRDLVVEQLRARIRMRNSEFSYPLSEERVEQIYNGDIDPEPFEDPCIVGVTGGKSRQVLHDVRLYDVLVETDLTHNRLLSGLEDQRQVRPLTVQVHFHLPRSEIGQQVTAIAGDLERALHLPVPVRLDQNSAFA